MRAQYRVTWEADIEVELTEEFPTEQAWRRWREQARTEAIEKASDPEWLRDNAIVETVGLVDEGGATK